MLLLLTATMDQGYVLCNAQRLGNYMTVCIQVLVVGPHDSGKTTTARILSSYATRLERTPLFVDLDVGGGLLSVPGCIGAVPLDKSSFQVEVRLKWLIGVSELIGSVVFFYIFREEILSTVLLYCITSDTHPPKTTSTFSNI